MPAFTTPKVRGELLFDVPMTSYNTWQVGGKADCVFKPADIEDLQSFIANIDDSVVLTWLGLGSNVLIRDGGIEGVVVVTQGCLDSFEFEADAQLLAQAGVACGKLARQVNKQGLSGLEFMAGIPGTVGGALAMNAGAHGASTWDRVLEATLINRKGELTTLAANEFEYGYRQLSLPQDHWFVSARFQLGSLAQNDNVISIKELMQHRTASQPIGKKNCGSVFMNPPGNYAAKMIEDCGLKGYKIGGASISDKHANFIINDDDASARDIEELMSLAKRKVKEKYGVLLTPEVKIIGVSE